MDRRRRWRLGRRHRPIYQRTRLGRYSNWARPDWSYATLGVGGEGTSKLLCRVQSRLRADSTRMARPGTLGSGSGGGGYWGGNGGQVHDYYGGGGGGSSLIPADAAVTSSLTRDPPLIQFTYDACGNLAQVSSMRARSKRYFSLFALRSIRLGLTTNGTFPSAATWCWFNVSAGAQVVCASIGSLRSLLYAFRCQNLCAENIFACSVFSSLKHVNSESIRRDQNGVEAESRSERPFGRAYYGSNQGKNVRQTDVIGALRIGSDPK